MSRPSLPRADPASPRGRTMAVKRLRGSGRRLAVCTVCCCSAFVVAGVAILRVKTPNGLIELGTSRGRRGLVDGKKVPSPRPAAAGPLWLRPAATTGSWSRRMDSRYPARSDRPGGSQKKAHGAVCTHTKRTQELPKTRPGRIKLDRDDAQADPAGEFLMGSPEDDRDA